MSKIFCIGELLIDFISSDNKMFTKNAGGAPANVAVTISRMGKQSSFLGQVGDDSFGDYLEQTLIKDHVDTTMLKKDGKTTLAFVSVDASGERSFEFNRGSDQDYEFSSIDTELIKSEDKIHFGSATGFLGGALEETYFKLLDFACKHGNFISFDPNYRSDLVLNKQDFIDKSYTFINKADLVKVSEEELILLTDIDNIQKAMRHLKKDSEAIIITTLGSEGCLLLFDDEFIHIPSNKVKQVDSTGAGDAFIGALLSVLDLSKPLDRDQIMSCVSFANKVGALTTTKFGAIPAIPFSENVNI